MKHGSKGNLNAKSCSDNSELAKSKKLLRMQKVALKRKKLVQVGVVCTQHYNYTKLHQLHELYQLHQTTPTTTTTKLQKTIATTPIYINYLDRN